MPRTYKLYDRDEDGGQTRFFSPAKVARIRQRNADAEQAEPQRKQDSSDKKLQQAIEKEDKEREAKAKKMERDFQRQTAREQVAQEKAEREANRESQRAQKEAGAA
jgi:hypothetical protein